MTDKQSKSCTGFLCGFWEFLNRPSARYSLGILLLVGFVGGVLFWGSFNWAMEATNNEAFCISCHEMRDNVYEEYKETVHYSNRTGVHATCPDCHVPKEWHYKVGRKIHVTNEFVHKALGSIDSPE